MKARVNTYLNIRTRSPEILPDNNPNDLYFNPGDLIEVVFEKVESLEIIKENIPLEIVYEDEDLAVRNWGKNWHQQVTQLYPCDITGDQMMPVPGCTQGGFTPKFIK